MKKKSKTCPIREVCEEVLVTLREARSKLNLRWKKERVLRGRVYAEVPAFATKVFAEISRSADRKEKSAVVCVHGNCRSKMAICMVEIKIWAVEKLLQAHMWGYQTEVIRTNYRRRSRNGNRTRVYKKVELKISW